MIKPIEKLSNEHIMRFCIRCWKRRLNEDFKSKNICRDCYNKYSREYQRRIAKGKK